MAERETADDSVVSAPMLDPRRAGTVACLLFSMVALSANGVARAACIESPEPSILALQTLAAADPNRAIAQADAMLIDSAASRASPTHIAWLHAVRAQSYSLLELDADARAAAAEGLKLVSDPREPVHLALFSTDAENVYDAAGIDDAKRSVEAARAAGIAGPGADICLLITLGTLQFRENRADLAVPTLTHAYRASDAAGRTEQRMLAASILSTVMRDLGDYRQALALNAEVIEWNAAHRETLSLSVSRYLRGVILLEMDEYESAVLALANARALSVSIGDQQGVAFSDMRICQVQIEQGALVAARSRCDNALSIFEAAGSIDVVKQTRSFLAHIDLEEGHAAQALATLDDLLANDATDMPPREVAPLFRLRAQARAALRQFPAAYSDLDEYTKRYTSTNELRQVQQAAALRARFETDREIDRNAALKRELAQSQQRQLELKQRTQVAIVAGALVIALLTAMLIITRRHRRQLAALANVDSLTGLPNRRYTGKVAKEELAVAAGSGQLLTIALIDLDHFKVINDQCGHAAGDQVLKEFAQTAREALRASDTFGRWGGEEFLLIMPGTTLDIAMGVVERLRSRALEIRLPANASALQVSLSAGLATNEGDARSLDALVARADAALYRAKSEGRNAVRIDAASIDSATSGVRRALG